MGLRNLFLLNISQQKKNQRIHQQKFNPSETLIKSPKSKGNRLTNKPIKYIDAKPGKWWDKNDTGMTDNNLF